MTYTNARLTYERGYSGKNWVIASVTFWGEDGPSWEIVTDGMKMDEFEYGQPEDDMRLWTAAPELLEALRSMLATDISRPNADVRRTAVKKAKAAIARATGEDES